MRARVVVTGMGAVTPVGNSVDEFVGALFEGRSGVGPISLFDASRLATRIAAEVKLPLAQLEFRDRKISFALIAARDAWAAATACGSHPGLDERGENAAVSLGIGLELFEMDDLVANRRPGFELPASLGERLSFMQTPSDLSVHLIAHRLGLHRPPLLHVSACAAGTDAIGSAYRLIANGRRRWMLAGAADSMVNPLGVAGFCTLNATSTRNDEPTRASRPFDAARDGFVLGEGAAVLVLERLEDARARGAHIHAEIIGYGTSLDAHAITEPHPEGRGALQAMRRALDNAGISADLLDAINAHGTGTPKNDPAETAAIKQLLGSRAHRVPICATKSMIGHLISAAGAAECVAAIAGMERGLLHPTLNLENADPLCDLDYVPLPARAHRQRHILSCSYGFGGQNAAIVLRSAEAIDDAA